MTDAALDDPDALLAREAELRARGGSLRMRDAAAALGVPEAALRRGAAADRRGACGCARPDAPEGFGRLLARLPEAGEVMALTRNETAVHEKVGRFAPPGIEGALGQVVGDIDLRLFLQHWRFGYALTEGGAPQPAVLRRRRHRDPQGLPPRRDRRRRLRRASSPPSPTPTPRRRASSRAAPPRPERPDAEVDVAGLRAAWDALEADPRVLRAAAAVRRDPRPGDAPRRPGVRPRRSRPRPPRRCSRARPRRGLPVMVFVGNRGCLQIHSGPVHRVEVVGPWLNVLDPGFNLHLREDRVAAAWVVRKPSVHGDIHSLELYDASRRGRRADLRPPPGAGAGARRLARAGERPHGALSWLAYTGTASIGSLRGYGSPCL